MKWKAFNPKEWHRRFAWLPVYIDGQVIWLEHYEARLICADVVDLWEARSLLKEEG